VGTGISNYAITYAKGTLTVGRKAASVTANNKNKIYGEVNPDLDAVVTGTVNGDVLAYSLATTTTQFSPASTYPITVTLGSNPNYVVTPANGTLTVGKRSVTVTPNSNQKKVYGSLNPTYSFSVTSGTVVNNDNFTGALSRTTGENVGNYTITNGNLSLGNNYNLTIVPSVQFEITSLPVTVTANAGQTKVYGTANPAVYSFSSSPAVGSTLANGEVISFTGVLNRVPGENVGAYAIGQNSLTNSNYTITYVGNNFTVTPALITIVVDNKTKVYGTVNPALTGTFTGALPADGITVSYNTTATRYSDVVLGGYTITASLNDPNAKLSNYTVTNTSGILTINKANASITITPYTGIYDGKPHTASAIVTGVQGEDLSSYVTFGSSYTNVPGGSTTWSFNGGINYNNANGTSTVTITPQTANPVGDAYYTGPGFYWTTSSSSKTATLTLAATITNNVNYTGDIRTARVSFFLRNATGTLTPISGAQNLPVGLVNPNDLGTGSASTNIQYTLGSTSVETLNIAVRITGGNYTGMSEEQYDGMVTVAVPTPGGMIVGGGKLCQDNSAGFVKGASDKRSEISFNVIYNKSLRTPQGAVEMTIKSYNDRNGVPGSTLRIYKVKSNAISVFAVNSPRAEFSSKGTISEIVNGVEQSIEGNITIQLNMYDAQALGNTSHPTDQIAVTVYRGKGGGIWYSNNWNGTQSALTNLCRAGDNLSVTGSGAATDGSIVGKVDDAQRVNRVIAGEPMNTFNLTAFPNPAISSFNVKLESSVTADKIQLRVMDIQGRTIEVRNNLNAGQTLRLGGDYRPGIYIIEMIQGNNRKQLKLMKQGD
jgi:hypothetical protein